MFLVNPANGPTFLATKKTFLREWDSHTVWIKNGYSWRLWNLLDSELPLLRAEPQQRSVNDATTSYNGTINGTTPMNTINTPFLPEIVPPVGRTLGTLGTQQYARKPFRTHDSRLADHPAGYVQQWNLNIQRILPGGIFVSAAYVGSKGTHLESIRRLTRSGTTF